MPNCVFHATGENFAVDGFLAVVQAKPYQVFRRGESFGKKGRIREHSGFSLDVSDSDDELSQDVEDAIQFLKKNHALLSKLADWPGVTDRRLDFGCYCKGWFLQSEYLPPELLKLAGELNIGIELSLYEFDKGEANGSES